MSKPKFPAPKYQYWRSKKNGRWYFHLKARNGAVVFQSQGYTTKRACVNTIYRIIDINGRLAGREHIIEETE